MIFLDRPGRSGHRSPGRVRRDGFLDSYTACKPDNDHLRRGKRPNRPCRRPSPGRQRQIHQLQRPDQQRSYAPCGQGGVARAQRTGWKPARPRCTPSASRWHRVRRRRSFETPTASRGGIRQRRPSTCPWTPSGVPGPNPSVICLLFVDEAIHVNGSHSCIHRRQHPRSYDADADATIKAGFVLPQDRAALLGFADPSAITNAGAPS